MLRQVIAVVVLTRICASLALILVGGASDLLEAAAFLIALMGLAPVILVISRMGSAAHPSLAPHAALGEGVRRPVAAR